MNQINLTDIYRTFHQNTKEYTHSWVQIKSQQIQEN